LVWLLCKEALSLLRSERREEIQLRGQLSLFDLDAQ
jgi:hypothetical protein